jgi:hypothetical protein
MFPQRFPSEQQNQKGTSRSENVTLHSWPYPPPSQPFNRSTCPWFIGSFVQFTPTFRHPFFIRLVLSRFGTSPYHAFKTLADLFPRARHVTSTTFNTEHAPSFR